MLGVPKVNTWLLIEAPGMCSVPWKQLPPRLSKDSARKEISLSQKWIALIPKDMLVFVFF